MDEVICMVDIICIIILAFIFYVMGYTAGRMNILNEFKNLINEMGNKDEV